MSVPDALEISAKPALTGRQQIVREGLWVAAGQVGAAVGLLVGTRLITELLPPEVYGTATLLLGVTLLAQNVFCTPVLSAGYRFHADLARDNGVWRLRRVTVRFLIWTTALLVGLLLIGGALFGHLAGLSIWPFVILAVLLTLNVAQSMEANFWIAARRQRPVSAVLAVEGLLRPGLVVLMAWLMGSHAESMLLGYLASSMAVYLGCYLLVRREGTDAPGLAGTDEADGVLRRQIIDYALPLMPLAVVAWVSTLSDRYVVGGMLGMEQAGVYASACGLMSQPFLLAYGTISRTLTPIYFQAVSHNNHVQARRIFRTFLAGTVSVGLVGFGLILLLRKWIVALLLAEEYREAHSLLPWIALGYCFYAVAWVYEKKLYAQKRTWRLLLIQTVVACTAAVVPALMIRPYGLVGASLGRPVAFAVMVLLMVGLSKEACPAGSSSRQASEDPTGDESSIAERQ